MTNGQAVVYYTRHHLTASVANVTTCTHLSINQCSMASLCLPIG